MEKVRTYLEFGSISGKTKKVYDTRFDQEAYEFFMVSRYLKDMLSYKKGEPMNVYHKEDLKDNMKKYLALCVSKSFSRELVYYEVGSSLMGIIEALEYLNNKYKRLDVKRIRFVGADNSKLMNFGARHLHTNYKLKLFLEKRTFPCDLFFAKGVSLLYAFDDEESFCDILKNSKIAIFDYTFSLGDSIKTFIGTGKEVTYLGFEKCKELLEDNKRSFVYVPSKREYKLDKKFKTYECVYGDKKTVERYLGEIKKFNLHDYAQ